MCLIVDKEKFKIETTQEDIVCYKVLEKNWKHRELRSPYRGFIYEIEEGYKTRMKPFFNGIYYKITAGFHSFLNKEDVESEKKWMQTYNFNDGTWDFCCFRCIIPKGTNVVYGKYNEKDTIVSEAIKIVEEV